jgi:hypothetical protein
MLRRSVIEMILTPITRACVLMAPTERRSLADIRMMDIPAPAIERSVSSSAGDHDLCFGGLKDAPSLLPSP